MQNMMQKHLTNLLCLAVVCAVVLIFSPFADSHHPKWLSFHLVTSIAVTIYFWRKYHWSLGVTVFATMFSGSMAFANRWMYSGLHVVEQIDIANIAAKATLTFLLLIIIADKLKLKAIWSLINAYIVVCFFHCRYVFYQLIFKPELTLTGSTGFLPNISMGPSMLAMLLPITVWRTLDRTVSKNMRIFYGASAALFIILTYIEQSSISYAAIVASQATLIFCVLSIIFGFWRSALVAGALVALMIPVGIIFDDEWAGFLSISRFQFWPMYFNWWKENASLLFGTGTGTFRHIGPVIQTLKQKDVGEWWLWAHNDWLQILFEVGILGALASLSLFITCIVRAYRAYMFELVAALVAMLVVMAGNYPLRLAEFATLVMLLLAGAMKLGPARRASGDHHT
jgi:hypothetical protein